MIENVAQLIAALQLMDGSTPVEIDSENFAPVTAFMIEIPEELDVAIWGDGS